MNDTEMAKVEHEVLTWVREAVKEGQEWYRDEPALPLMESLKGYLHGDQEPVTLPGRSRVFINRTKKIFLEFVSAMTDVRSIFEWSTFNAKYQPDASKLNKLTRAWWRNTHADAMLADALKFSGVGGSG